MFGSLGNAFTNITGDVLGMPQQAFNNLMEVGKEAKTDPLKFLKDQTGISDLQALTLPPDEYAKYVAANGGMSRRAIPALNMPALSTPMAPNAPTGGFVNQMPNYLNFAQQALGGPYG